MYNSEENIYVLKSLLLKLSILQNIKMKKLHAAGMIVMFQVKMLNSEFFTINHSTVRSNYYIVLHTSPPQGHQCSKQDKHVHHFQPRHPLSPLLHAVKADFSAI
jgi:hypothetical protein